MAEQKLTKEELINIADSLSYLASKETPAWYQIGKNLRLVKPFMKEVEGVREDIKKNCGAYDDNGQLKTENINGMQMIVWKDKKAEKEQLKIWNEFINEDAPELNWHKFSIDKLKDVELNGGLLSNLIDLIIIEDGE